MNIDHDDYIIANNCARPPHFPPHCGCPAGCHPGDDEGAKEHPQDEVFPS